MFIPGMGHKVVLFSLESAGIYTHTEMLIKMSLFWGTKLCISLYGHPWNCRQYSRPKSRYLCNVLREAL